MAALNNTDNYNEDEKVFSEIINWLILILLQNKSKDSQGFGTIHGLKEQNQILILNFLNLLRNRRYTGQNYAWGDSLVNGNDDTNYSNEDEKWRKLYEKYKYTKENDFFAVGKKAQSKIKEPSGNDYSLGGLPITSKSTLPPKIEAKIPEPIYPEKPVSTSTDDVMQLLQLLLLKEPSFNDLNLEKTFPFPKSSKYTASLPILREENVQESIFPEKTSSISIADLINVMLLLSPKPQDIYNNINLKMDDFYPQDMQNLKKEPLEPSKNRDLTTPDIKPQPYDAITTESAPLKNKRPISRCYSDHDCDDDQYCAKSGVCSYFCHDLQNPCQVGYQCLQLRCINIPEQPLPCKDNSDCPSSEFCSFINQCTRGCTENVQCSPLDVCIGNICIPERIVLWIKRNLFNADKDLFSLDKKNTMFPMRIPHEVENPLTFEYLETLCSHCKGNQYCDFKGVCIEYCSLSNPCKKEYSCYRGICVTVFSKLKALKCSTDEDCMPGNACNLFNYCSAMCSLDAKCADSEVCVQNLCYSVNEIQIMLDHYLNLPGFICILKI